MNCIGNKEVFAIEYEVDNDELGKFELWVYSNPVCRIKNGEKGLTYVGNINDIALWLKDNLENITSEDEFPLPVRACSSIDFYKKSGMFDSEDLDVFDRWYTKRQDWYFRHTWYCIRRGSYLAEIYFRCVENKIEIEWDNVNLYEGIHFLFPKGIYYVETLVFLNVVRGFLNCLGI